MKQPCASVARLRGSGPILMNGSMTVFRLGSPPPRIVISVQPGVLLALKLVSRLRRSSAPSARGPQHDAMRNLAGRDHPPQGDEQFPGEGDDQDRLAHA